MSRDVVRSSPKGWTVAFAEAEDMAAGLDVIVPVLDTSKPISGDFDANWEAAQSHFEKVVVANEKQSAIRLAKKSNFPAALTKVASWWEGLKYKFTTFMSVNALVMGAAVVFLTPSIMEWGDYSTYFSAAVNASMLPVSPMLLVMGGTVLVAERFQKQVKAVLNKAFNSGYEQRVIQWAQERYGVTIPAGAWASPIGRVSQDLVYLGVKDGQKVYCFTSEQGWIIGYRDGTELPVLANKKELAEA